MYCIREVDGTDEEIADTLRALHTLTFFDSAPPINPEVGHWWLAYCGGDAVAFAGMRPSITLPSFGYLERVGVLPGHRGHGLQRRLLRCREARAKRNGWLGVISDTTDNVPSANNLIASGYRIFSPKAPWSFSSAVYWRKVF